MAQAWTFSGAPPVIEGGPMPVTLVEGSTFCISTSAGNVIPGAPMGLFVRDTRLLAHWELNVDGAGLEPLAVSSDDPFQATFVTRARPRPGQPESTLLVTRDREIGEGMTEVLRVRNLGHEVAGVTLELRVDSDFADLFEVKEGRAYAQDGVVTSIIDGGLLLRREQDGHSRSARIVADPPDRMRPAAGRMVWHLAIAPRDEWCVQLVVDVLVDDRQVSAGAADEERTAARRIQEWRVGAPVLTTPDAGLGRTLGRSMEDLGALRIVDPDHPGRAVVAAGAPWFMALFGRDSLLTAWMALPLDPSPRPRHATAPWPRCRAAPTTRSPRSSRAGSCTSAGSGRRPRAMRGGVHGLLRQHRLRPRCSSCFSASCCRWGLAEDEVDALLPAADRALEWITTYGDRDGDGFVEYRAGHRPRAAQPGLEGLLRRDHLRRRPARRPRRSRCPRCRPTSYGAYLARGHFAREAGDDDLACPLGRRAADLKRGLQRPRSGCPTAATTRSPWTATSGRSTRSPRTWAIACGPASLTSDTAPAPSWSRS